MNYGLPYMGSKSKIVKEFFHIFPKARHFYDMFGGGGAVTHYAAKTGRYQHVHYNELSHIKDTFSGAIDGLYSDMSHWVTREEFEQKRMTDSYIALCWSFGNKCDTYIYGKEMEHWKRALHYARVLGDTGEFEKFGIRCDGSDVSAHKKKYRDAYVRWYIREILKLDLDSLGDIDSLDVDGLEGKYPHETVSTLKRLLALDNFEALQNYSNSKRVIELGSLKRMKDNGRLLITQMDYRDVPIEDDSVIYCDPPYRGTGSYVVNKEGDGFDHEAFYDWCESLDKPVFISEYGMPEDRFDCILEMEHRCTLSATENTAVIEKIFVPKRQTEKLTKRLSLF